MATRKHRTPQHEERCRGYADRLIPVLRERARELGYALGVHGSLSFDIDLIACPWSRTAVPGGELAEALRAAAQKEIGFAFMERLEGADEYHLKGCPGMKPHGRLCWSFHLGGGPYIDLSVMPLAPQILTPPVLLNEHPELVPVTNGRSGFINEPPSE